MPEGNGPLEVEAEEDEDGNSSARNKEGLDVDAFLTNYEKLDNVANEIDGVSIDAKDVGLDIDIGGVWAGDDANELCSAAAKKRSAGHSSAAENSATTAPPLSRFRKDEEASGRRTRFVDIFPAAPCEDRSESTYQPLPKKKRGPYRDGWPRESTTQTPYPGHRFGWGSTIHPTMRQNEHQESFKERWVTVSEHYGESESEGELEERAT